MAIVKNRAMRQTGCFGSGGRTGCELNVDSVIIEEVLRLKCTRRRAVEEVRKGGSTFEGAGVNATRGIVDQN